MVDKAKKIELNHLDDGILEITIHGYIGYDFTAGDLISYLSYFKDDINLILNIFSGGGSYVEAIAVYEYLISKGVEATANIYGLAGSAATIIACACQIVNITENSDYFIHRASYVDGSDDDTKEIQRANDVIIGIYRKKTGLGKSKIEKLLDAGDSEEIITAQEAKELGFVDNIIKTTSRKQNEKKMAIAAYKKAHGIAPKINNQKKPNMAENSILEKVAQWMGLSSVDQIKEHIENHDIKELVANQVQEAIPETVKAQIENSLKPYAKADQIVNQDDIVNAITKRFAPTIAKAMDDYKKEVNKELTKRDEKIVELTAKIEGKPTPTGNGKDPKEAMRSIGSAFQNDLLANIEAARKHNNQ